jgi:hypothetical protein
LRPLRSMEHPGRDFHHELPAATQKSPAFLRRPGFSYAT